MKLRIKELAKKAGGNPNYKAFRGHPLPPPPDYIDPATVDLEKFAELIVRECCLQVADVRIENDFEPVGDAVLVRALAGIKKYFGVEE